MSRMAKMPAAEEQAIAKQCEPKPEERATLEALRARWKEKPPAPRLKVSQKAGVACTSLDHEDQTIGRGLLMAALGTTDQSFLDGFLGQLINVGSQGGEVDERALNFMLSVVKSVDPRDEVEAMLAAQMAAVHMATMNFARRLGNVENIQQQDSAERAFNKLARTFVTQLQALRRYRTGGEQMVTVKHVTVNEGGQAIVGNVSRGPGGGGAE